MNSQNFQDEAAPASPFHLLSDAIQFLRDGRQLEYDFACCEAGRVILHSLDRLALSEVWIEDVQVNLDSDQQSYYAIPAVSLSRECEGYSPEFLLLWLPNERVFGAWDIDHWVLTVFPGVSWAQIVADPLTYLNAQWQGEGAGSQKFDPSKTYAPISGWPF